MNVIKVKKSLDDSGVLIDEVTEIAKHRIKKQQGIFLGALLAAPVVRPVIYSVVKDIRRRGSRKVGR